MTDIKSLQETVDACAKFSTKALAAKHLGISIGALNNRLNRAELLKITAGGEPPKYLQGRPCTVVYFTDPHNQPTLPRDRFHWLAKYINDQCPDHVVCGGDFDDFHSLCSHERNDTGKGKLKPAFLEDIEACAEALQIINEGLNCLPALHITMGNHEHRIWTFEDKNPETKLLMQQKYLDIWDMYNWEVKLYGDFLDIHGVEFTHVPMNGLNRPYGGKLVCKNVAENLMKDLVFGHTHVNGFHTHHKIGPTPRSTSALNGGCFMPDGYVPEYAKGSQKHPWYGCFTIQIQDGRIVAKEEITMRELERRYAR